MGNGAPQDAVGVEVEDERPLTSRLSRLHHNAKLPISKSRFPLIPPPGGYLRWLAAMLFAGVKETDTSLPRSHTVAPLGRPLSAWRVG